ncbi:MAG: hypothetical protein LBJ64_03280 [Deltaproteobacteria bacterium]|nr:hypothetical protein [Deltaproteobacteria bacterium]
MSPAIGTGLVGFAPIDQRLVRACTSYDALSPQAGEEAFFGESIGFAGRRKKNNFAEKFRLVSQFLKIRRSRERLGPTKRNSKTDLLPDHKISSPGQTIAVEKKGEK